VPQPHRYYGEGHLPYLTTRTCRRARVFDSERSKRRFVTTLSPLRAEWGFRIVGYVLMPEPFHLLIWPGTAGNPSRIMPKQVARTS
jgi:REP element-mobilizing transposase RayT